MKRLILASLLLAAPAVAAEVPSAKCTLRSTLKVSPGNAIMGPIDVGVTNGAPSSLHLDDGTTLRGPLKIEVCDGHVTISAGDLK